MEEPAAVPFDPPLGMFGVDRSTLARLGWFDSNRIAPRRFSGLHMVAVGGVTAGLMAVAFDGCGCSTRMLIQALSAAWGCRRSEKAAARLHWPLTLRQTRSTAPSKIHLLLVAGSDERQTDGAVLGLPYPR